MNSAKIYLSNNSSYVTSVSEGASEDSIISYFLGQSFEQCDGSMAKCEAVYLNNKYHFCFTGNKKSIFKSDVESLFVRYGFKTRIDSCGLLNGTKDIPTICGIREFSFSFANGGVQATYDSEGRNVLAAMNFYFHYNMEAAMDFCLDEIKKSYAARLLEQK